MPTLLNLTNKNACHPVKLDFQINNDFFSYKYVSCNIYDMLLPKLFDIYLEFKFNWAP